MESAANEIADHDDTAHGAPAQPDDEPKAPARRPSGTGVGATVEPPPLEPPEDVALDVVLDVVLELEAPMYLDEPALAALPIELCTEPPLQLDPEELAQLSGLRRRVRATPPPPQTPGADVAVALGRGFVRRVIESNQAADAAIQRLTAAIRSYNEAPSDARRTERSGDVLRARAELEQVAAAAERLTSGMRAPDRSRGDELAAELAAERAAIPRIRHRDHVELVRRIDHTHRQVVRAGALLADTAARLAWARRVGARAAEVLASCAVPPRLPTDAE